MKLNVSLRNRVRQLFCKHDSLVGLSCATQGINSKEGKWYFVYRCEECNFSYGEWIEANKEEVEKRFDRDVHDIK